MSGAPSRSSSATTLVDNVIQHVIHNDIQESLTQYATDIKNVINTETADNLKDDSMFLSDDSTQINVLKKYFDTPSHIVISTMPYLFTILIIY